MIFCKAIHAKEKGGSVAMYVSGLDPEAQMHWDEPAVGVVMTAAEALELAVELLQSASICID